MSMRNFVIRRILLMVPLFIGVSIISFVIVSLSPVDIVDVQSTGAVGLTEDDKLRQKEEYHFVTRPETKIAPSSVISGWVTNFPATRSFHFDDSLAIVKFDDSSEVNPEDHSRTAGNLVTIDSTDYYQRIASNMTLTNIDETTNVTIENQIGGWNVDNEFTVMFWMNWSSLGVDNGTLLVQGSDNFTVNINRPAAFNSDTFNETWINFTVGSDFVLWRNNTNGGYSVSNLFN